MRLKTFCHKPLSVKSTCFLLKCPKYMEYSFMMF